MARRRTPSSQCPAYPEHCDAASPNQHDINPESLRAVGISGDWVNAAMQCGYCGLVYSKELNIHTSTMRTVKRGYFGGNTLMTANNWEPLNA